MCGRLFSVEPGLIIIRPAGLTLSVSLHQVLMMKPQVLSDKGRNKEEGVIVARLQSVLEWIPGALRRIEKDFWLQLFYQEVVRIALINQHRQMSGCALHELARVVLTPGILISTQVMTKSLFSPGTLHRCADRCEG